MRCTFFCYLLDKPALNRLLKYRFFYIFSKIVIQFIQLFLFVTINLYNRQNIIYLFKYSSFLICTQRRRKSFRAVYVVDSFLADQLAKNSKTEPETFTGSQIKSTYPVEGESWSSKLTEADVQSATCEEKDGKYVITITTVADGKSDSIKHGQGHAPKAFNVVLPGVVNDNIPGVATSIVGTATMNYPSSTVKVVVDPATGHVISANYDLYWTINFDKAGAILPFHTSDSYTIKY